MIDQSQSSAPARLVAYAGEECIAVPEHCAIALVEAPEVFEVPGAPPHCAGLIEWAGDLIPLIDLQVLAAVQARVHKPLPSHVLVLGWQAESGAPVQYGAVCAPSLVRTVRVSDAQHCEPPAPGHSLARVSVSYFDSGGRLVPIIDTRRLFAGSALVA